MMSRAHRWNTRAMVLVATTVAVATAGCGSRERRSVAESAVASAPSSGASPGGAPVGDWHVPAPGVPCPSTGGWGPCTVLERLDRAGLAPRVAPDMVGEAPLQQSGRLI